jgi:hypothetical protein
MLTDPPKRVILVSLLFLFVTISSRFTHSTRFLNNLGKIFTCMCVYIYQYVHGICTPFSIQVCTALSKGVNRVFQENRKVEACFTTSDAEMYGSRMLNSTF